METIKIFRDGREIDVELFHALDPAGVLWFGYDAETGAEYPLESHEIPDGDPSDEDLAHEYGV